MKSMETEQGVNLGSPMEPMGGQVIVEMNDYDWCAGPSVEACREWYLKQSGFDTDDVHPRVISLGDSLQLTYRYEDKASCCFGEALRRLVASGQKFPCLFATTEY